MAPKDPVVQAGATILRLKAKHVPKHDITSPKLRKLIAKMSRILKKEEFGVAIAAPQVGVSSRLFVIAGRAFDSESKKKGDDGEPTPDMVFINPEILRLSRKKREMSEGCLSVRGKYGTVLRHEKATVRAEDINGAVFTYHGSGLIAHIFQHECDHLDGILYTDKVERLEDEVKREELKEAYPAGKAD